MFQRPTALGAALFKAASTFPGTNHPLARVVKNKISLNAPAFSVVVRDTLPVKEQKT